MKKKSGDPFGRKVDKERHDEFIAQTVSSNNEFAVWKHPSDSTYTNLAIPKRFDMRILTHIVAPYLSESVVKSPMFLAIVGDAGEGKTAQSIATCCNHGFSVLYCSASNLSGRFESDAKAGMNLLYEDAVASRKKGNFVSIVIDDFHKGLVNTNDKVEKTINSELLTGFLMNLTERHGNERIPIIFTANTLDDVYQPLLRFGRADVYPWIPYPKEKFEAVKLIFGNFVAADEIETFFNSFQNESIAFFTQVLNRTRINYLTHHLGDIKIIDAKSVQNININFAETLTKKALNSTQLIELATTIKSERGDNK